MAERLIRRISPRAREALWHMARSAPSITFKELQDELDLDGLGLGGVLASFGFAERAGLPRPYEADHSRREYLIDPKVATVVLDAFEVFEKG
jgi:hypothetical protein